MSSIRVGIISDLYLDLSGIWQVSNGFLLKVKLIGKLL